MTNVKPFYRSATLWSIIFSTGAFLVSRYIGVQASDIPVPPNPDFEQLKAVANEVQQAKNNTGELISVILGSAGAISGIYNRIVATNQLVSGSNTDAPPIAK